MCRNATTDLPQHCWKKLSTISGIVRKINNAEVLSFCEHVQNRDQVDCAYGRLKYDRQTFSKAAQECQNVALDEDDEVPQSKYTLEENIHMATDDAIGTCMRKFSGAREWSVGDAQTLCAQAASDKQVNVIIQCALDVSKLNCLAISDVARVCRTAGWVEEREDFIHYQKPVYPVSSSQRGRVAACVHAAYKEITTSSSVRIVPDAELVISACHTVQSSVTGSCIASFSNRKMQDFITSDALLDLCKSPNGLSKLSCLKLQRQLRPTKSTGPITPAEVRTCTSVPSQVQSLRLINFETTMSSTPTEFVAGRFFSVTFEMLDQVLHS